MSQTHRLHLFVQRAGQLGYWQVAPDGSARQLPAPAQAQAPLGSLWKLWVYAYLASNDVAPSLAPREAPYHCQGNNPEEVYCCSAPGESLGRDAALAKSCGLYFQPARLQIHPDQWCQFWQGRNLPDVLRDLNRLTPEQEVPIAEILASLAELPAQNAARRALLAVMVNPTGTLYAQTLGSRLRAKTWSWRNNQGAPIGGFAGWLADGTPLWAQAEGTSAQVLQRYQRGLNQLLPNPLPVNPDSPCVLVTLFANYPMAQVLNQHNQP